MNLTKEEAVVLHLIQHSPGKITQSEIARHERWLGCHPKHEAHLNIDKRESTLRKIRQIIRDLRLKRGFMILSDNDGYWIMKDRAEAVEYLNRIEKMAKAQSRSWFETYTAMKKNYGITSAYFEQQATQNRFA